MPAQTIPPLLLPEALGFSPQLLLDDIINVANNAVTDGLNGMEEFLQRWADTRAEREGGDWDSTHEVEQGLVAFQTLLEYHTDIAFDFFEAWSLRNIFAVPPDLPLVLPHHEKLDLGQTPEREQELIDEIEYLRNEIDNGMSGCLFPDWYYISPCGLATSSSPNVLPRHPHVENPTTTRRKTPRTPVTTQVTDHGRPGSHSSKTNRLARVHFCPPPT